MKCWLIFFSYSAYLDKLGHYFWELLFGPFACFKSTHVLIKHIYQNHQQLLAGSSITSSDNDSMSFHLFRPKQKSVRPCTVAALVRNNYSPKIGTGDLLSGLRSVCLGESGWFWLHVPPKLNKGNQKNKPCESVQKQCWEIVGKPGNCKAYCAKLQTQKKCKSYYYMLLKHLAIK